MIELGNFGVVGKEDGMATPETHARLHRRVAQRVREVIESYRTVLGIEPAWSFDISVCCSWELAHEGAIWFDSEAWYTRLFVRCQLNQELLKWVTLHEMCELQTWRTASFVRESLLLPSEQQEWKRAWQKTRNQEIELRLYGLLGKRRPGHLIESGQVDEEDEEKDVDDG